MDDETIDVGEMGEDGEVFTNSMLHTLTQQRDAALNGVVNLRAQVEVLTARLKRSETDRAAAEGKVESLRATVQNLQGLLHSDRSAPETIDVTFGVPEAATSAPPADAQTEDAL